MKKLHRFQDCSGFSWRMPGAERDRHTTSDIMSITCGTCKQRILNIILNLDWNLLPTQDLEDALKTAAIVCENGR